MVSSSDIRTAVYAQRDDLFNHLSTFVSFPSVHGDDMVACKGAADAVQAAFAAEGVELEAIDTIDGSITLAGYVPPGDGKPTVLLYSHYDVQPSGDESAWTSNPWTLTERDGRWYARGAADCKGNIVVHLAVLRALRELAGAEADAGGFAGTGIGLRIIVEGSEERGSAGLENLIATQPERFAADATLIVDTGNVAVGEPTLNTVLRGAADVIVSIDTMGSAVHSGAYGGAAPDALAALIRLLDSLRDEHGRIAIDGLESDQKWTGRDYPEADFRADAGVLDGVETYTDADLDGTDGTDGGEHAVADLLWTRPAVTVTGMDVIPLAKAINAVQGHAAAQINLRVPPGMDPKHAQDKLVAHLEKHVPWGAKLSIERDTLASPFSANTDGEAFTLLRDALTESYGKDTVLSGEGGSIPLCTALTTANPETELMLFGIEEPLCRIHAIDESVNPQEIMDIATAEAIFIMKYSKKDVASAK